MLTDLSHTPIAVTLWRLASERMEALASTGSEARSTGAMARPASSSDGGSRPLRHQLNERLGQRLLDPLIDRDGELVSHAANGVSSTRRDHECKFSTR